MKNGFNRAASRSVLPEDLPTLGGKRFMTVATRAPESQEEKRGRMADLMERFLEEGSIPVGVDLVQRAVRQLARRMGIRILHPDPDHYVRNIEIPELARLSGGEQLTAPCCSFAPWPSSGPASGANGPTGPACSCWTTPSATPPGSGSSLSSRPSPG